MGQKSGKKTKQLPCVVELLLRLGDGFASSSHASPLPVAFQLFVCNVSNFASFYFSFDFIFFSLSAIVLKEKKAIITGSYLAFVQSIGVCVCVCIFFRVAA